jgi:hypothetical protein
MATLGCLKSDLRFGVVSVPSRGCTVLPLLASSLAALGCGVLGYYTSFSSRSPHGESAIRVLRNLPGAAAEYRFRVEVSSPKGTAVIYRSQSTAAIGLIEAHWSQDGNEVGLLVCNKFNKRISALVGYDIANGYIIEGSVFRSALGAQIRRKYSLPTGVESIDWACSQAGSAAYSAAPTR